MGAQCLGSHGRPQVLLSPSIGDSCRHLLPLARAPDASRIGVGGVLLGARGDAPRAQQEAPVRRRTASRWRGERGVGPCNN